MSIAQRIGLSLSILFLTGCCSVQVQRTGVSESFTWRSLRDAEVLLLPVVTGNHEMYVPVSTDAVVPLVERHFRRSTLVLDVPRVDPNHGGVGNIGYWGIVREAARRGYSAEPAEDFAVLVRTFEVERDRRTWEEEDDEGTEKEFWESTAKVTIGVYLIDVSDGTLAWFAEGSTEVAKQNRMTRWEEADGDFLENLLHDLFVRPIVGAIVGEREGYPDYPVAEATYAAVDKLLDEMPK